MSNNINRLEGSSNMSEKFDQKSFIAFLTKVSILHESDMDEIQRFQQVKQEDDALYHLSDYFERLGDVDPFDNAEKTLESYKNYLLYGEIVDSNENDNHGNYNDHEQQGQYYSSSKQTDIQDGRQNSIYEDQFLRGKDGDYQNNSRFSQQQSVHQNRQRYDQNGLIHERLYQQAFNKQEFQILMNEIKKEQELKDCTFAPKITPKGKSPLRSQNSSQDKVFQRLSQKKKMSLKEQQSSWQKREDLELSKCTFHPQINKQKRDGTPFNEAGMQSDQDKVFSRLYNKYGARSDARKISFKGQNQQISNNSSTISNSRKNIGNRSSNQFISQKERDLLEDEQMITPAKLKNKKDFLKWQNWHQQYDDNSENQTQNSGSQYYQQQIQQYNSNQEFQGYNKQNQPRGNTPVRQYNQYKSASPVSRNKMDEKLSSVISNDTKQVHERLYNLHFQRLNQQLIKEVESNFMQKKELSFKPEIYTQNYRQHKESQQEEQENSKDMFQRLYDQAEVFQQRLVNKRKEKEDEIQEQIKQSHPHINKKSEIIAQHNRSSTSQNAFERLYEVSKQKDKNYEKLKSKVSFEEGCTFKPITNQYQSAGIKRDISNNRKHENNSQQISNENQNINNFNDSIQTSQNKQILQKKSSFNSSIQSQKSFNKDKLQQSDSINHNDRHQSQQMQSPDYFQQLLKQKSNSQQQAETFGINTPNNGQNLNQMQISQYSNQEPSRQFNAQQQQSVNNKTSLPFNAKKNSFFA